MGADCPDNQGNQGNEFVRDQGGLPGVAPYWLTLPAAQEIYNKFAV